ncbi:hypothetical protein BOX15_Mlig016375g1 [Macrostomum lignano]|uniref:Uncharacterized protein n=1 Tax=Macrostomum lignano TaxID=282301 RepID=A0A267EAC9_9PLAT|nr:hypothetical protein BOX15_Mlig016375g1 [Macrostomum lignano]
MASSNTNSSKTLTTVEDHDGWTLVNYDDISDNVDEGFLLAGGASGGNRSDSSSSAEVLKSPTPTSGIDANDDEVEGQPEASPAGNQEPAPAATARAVVAAAAAASGHRAAVAASSSSSSSSAVALCHSAASRAASRTRAKLELSRASLARRNQVATLRCSAGSGASAKRQMKMRGTVKCPQARSASKKC